MAKSEQEREDMFREATALVERCELHVEGCEPVVIGFRKDGCASIYFGDDPVYHFNALNELRRSHEGIRLIKAEKGRLVALQRERPGGEVQLIRHELNDQETSEYLARLTSRLDELRTQFKQRLVSAKHVPSGVDVVGRVRNWLNERDSEIVIARSPHAR